MRGYTHEGSTPSPGIYSLIYVKTINYKWDSNLSYIVGLIATDGNLSKDKRHILFTTTDRQLARTFTKCIGIKTRIALTPPSGFGKKPVFRINFSNVCLFRFLEEIGLMPNKTHSIGKLNIPDKYFADFLRGHLDGDGSVFTYIDRYMQYKGKRYTYNRLYTVFKSASAKHLRWIQSPIGELLHIKGALNSYQKKDRKYPVWNLRFSKTSLLTLL